MITPNSPSLDVRKSSIPLNSLSMNRDVETGSNAISADNNFPTPVVLLNNIYMYVFNISVTINIGHYLWKTLFTYDEILRIRSKKVIESMQFY